MGAKRKPERKADVLNAMADYLLGSGLSAATLRPVASAAGTSAGRLLYHFGSKEELLVEALREVRRREIAMLARSIARLPDASPTDVLRAVWRWYASPRRAPYLELFFEAWGASLRHPYLRRGFLEHVRKDLLPLIERVLVQRGYPRRDAAAVATFMIAAFRGLLIDLVANRDRRRLDDAMAVFVLVTEVMEAQGPTAARTVLGEGAADPRPRTRAGTRPSRAAPRRRRGRHR